jgi:hypothetical protein
MNKIHIIAASSGVPQNELLTILKYLTQVTCKQFFIFLFPLQLAHFRLYCVLVSFDIFNAEKSEAMLTANIRGQDISVYRFPLHNMRCCSSYSERSLLRFIFQLLAQINNDQRKLIETGLTSVAFQSLSHMQKLFIYDLTPTLHIGCACVVQKSQRPPSKNGLKTLACNKISEL